MTQAGAIRLLQAATLTAAAATGVAYFEFGAVEVAVAMIGASAVAVGLEVLVTRPAAPAPPVRWSVDELAARVPGATRDPRRREEFEHLVARLREFADEQGRLPADFDAFVRETLPELVRR